MTEITEKSFIGDTTLAEIPTLDSIGPTGARGHSIEESMLMEDFGECAKRLASIMYCI